MPTVGSTSIEFCIISPHRQNCEQFSMRAIVNESVPKIIKKMSLFFKTAISILVISNHNSYGVLFDKLLPYILFEKYIYILALETARPENQHCANCIGTFSFPAATDVACCVVCLSVCLSVCLAHW